MPRDFVWMYLALLMMLAFLALAACVREHAASVRRVFGTIGLCFAVVSFAVIALDYRSRATRTVQPALLRGGLDGLVIFSQYNPHGVFIALEELGFLVMGLYHSRFSLSRLARHVLNGSRAGCIWSPRR